VTISPHPPAHLLTVAEYAALGEDEHGRTELMEGKSEVLVAVEIVSPGSPRIDNIVKRAEYQDAGIPHYWIDTENPICLVACHLTTSGYRDEPAVTGTYETDEPFALRIDLEALL
jgi:hypothetical protein